jgi:hypothetical protein
MSKKNIDFKITKLGAWVLSEEYDTLKKTQDFLRLHPEDELKEVSPELFDGQTKLGFDVCCQPCFTFGEGKEVKVVVKHGDRILHEEKSTCLMMGDLLDCVSESEDELGKNSYHGIHGCIFRISSTPDEVVVTLEDSDRVVALEICSKAKHTPEANKAFKKALDDSVARRRLLCKEHFAPSVPTSIHEIRDHLEEVQAMGNEIIFGGSKAEGSETQGLKRKKVDS